MNGRTFRIFHALHSGDRIDINVLAAGIYPLRAGTGGAMRQVRP
jgi:hypothetical protein